MAWGDDVLVVAAGHAAARRDLARGLRPATPPSIMKIGRNLAKVREALARRRHGRRARSMSSARTHGRTRSSCRSRDKRDDAAPYFSMVARARRGPAAVSRTRSAIVGLGPGARELADARRRRRRSPRRPTLVGYAPYLDRAAARAPGSAATRATTAWRSTRARARARARRRGRRRRASSPAAIPASSRWRRRCSRRSSAATAALARARRSRSRRASARCRPPPRGSARRSAMISARSRCRTI